MDPEHVALAGFLGGYRGLTRDAYALDLRKFVEFCAEGHLRLLEVRRSDIEAFGRDLEAAQDRLRVPRYRLAGPANGKVSVSVSEACRAFGVSRRAPRSLAKWRQRSGSALPPDGGAFDAA